MPSIVAPVDDSHQRIYRFLLDRLIASGFPIGDFQSAGRLSVRCVIEELVLGPESNYSKAYLGKFISNIRSKLQGKKHSWAIEDFTLAYYLVSNSKLMSNYRELLSIRDFLFLVKSNPGTMHTPPALLSGIGQTYISFISADPVSTKYKIPDNHAQMINSTTEALINQFHEINETSPDSKSFSDGYSSAIVSIGTSLLGYYGTMQYLQGGREILISGLANLFIQAMNYEMANFAEGQRAHDRDVANRGIPVGFQRPPLLPLPDV